MILTKNICFQNIKIKLNSGTWMTLQSSVVIFQALEPLQPQWPLQPQQPQWPQWPLQPHFNIKFTELDFSINPCTKTTYCALMMWVGSEKTRYFLDFCHSFFWRLWRTGMLLLTKSKGHKSNSPYSGFPREKIYHIFLIWVVKCMR